MPEPPARAPVAAQNRLGLRRPYLGGRVKRQRSTSRAASAGRRFSALARVRAADTGEGRCGDVLRLVRSRNRQATSDRSHPRRRLPIG